MAAAAAGETAQATAAGADSALQPKPIPAAQAAVAMATAATGMGSFGTSQVPGSSAAASAVVQQEAVDAAAGSSAAPPSAEALQQPFRLPSTLSEASQGAEGDSSEADAELAADDAESGTEDSDEELMSRWEVACLLTCSSPAICLAQRQVRRCRQVEPAVKWLDTALISGDCTACSASASLKVPVLAWAQRKACLSSWLRHAPPHQLLSWRCSGLGVAGLCRAALHSRAAGMMAQRRGLGRSISAQTHYTSAVGGDEDEEEGEIHDAGMGKCDFWCL